MLSDCTLCLLKRQTFVVRKLFFFVVIFWPTGGDCHAELSLVGGGGRWEVGGGRVSYGRSVTHLGSLASLSLSPSFARESSRPQLSLGSSQALGLYEHKLTNTTSGCWFFLKIHSACLFKLSHLWGSVWAKFCLSAQACLLLNLVCPLPADWEHEQEEQFIGCAGRSGGWLSYKGFSPSSPNYSSQTINYQTIRLQFQFLQGGKNIEIGFADINSESTTEFSWCFAKKYNHHTIR